MLNRSYKKYFVLAGLFALFVLPFGSAWFIYHSPQVHQFAKKNHGTLLSPIHNLYAQNWHDIESQNNLNKADLEGKWGILLVSYPSCHHPNHLVNPIVEKRWKELDKVKVSLGKDQNRLTLVQAFPGLNTPLGQQEGDLYLFDPFGNIVLHYTATQDSRDLRKDLKRLLHASNIG